MTTANDNKVVQLPTDAISMAATQKQLLMDQAKFEQELAKTDRLMKGRATAFSLATEAMKAGAFSGDIDALIKEAGKIETFLSVGADEYVKIANTLNKIDEQQDELVISAPPAVK